MRLSGRDYEGMTLQPETLNPTTGHAGVEHLAVADLSRLLGFG